METQRPAGKDRGTVRSQGLQSNILKDENAAPGPWSMDFVVKPPDR